MPDHAPRITCGPYRLEADEGGLHLFVGTTRITCGTGLHSVIETQSPGGQAHVRLTSDHASFSTRTEGDRLVAELSWPRHPFSIRWTLAFLSPGVLRWNIEHRFQDTATVRELKFGAMFSGSFDRWKAGPLTAAFASPPQWEDVFSGPCPALSLEGAAAEPAHLACPHAAFEGLVQNTANGARMLQYRLVPARVFPRDTELVVEACLSLGQAPAPARDRKTPENEALPGLDFSPLHQAALTDGPLALTADLASGLNLRWQDAPLLDAPGLAAELTLAVAGGPDLVLSTRKTSRARLDQPDAWTLEWTAVWDHPEFWPAPVAVELLCRLRLEENATVSVALHLSKPSGWPARMLRVELLLPAAGYGFWRGSFEEGPFPPPLRRYECPMPYRETALWATGGKNRVGFLSDRGLFPVVRSDAPEAAQQAIGFEFQPGDGTPVFSGRLCAGPETQAAAPGAGQPPSRAAQPAAATVTVLGDTAWLHDRVLANPRGTLPADADVFDRLPERLDRASHVRIGVHRYNFSRVRALLEWVLRRAGRFPDLRDIELPLFPVNALGSNLRQHLLRLQQAAWAVRGPTVELFVLDGELFEILDEVGRLSLQHSPRDLLRYLGVIAEHALIGPRVMVLDPYHRCNANCLHCWVHTPGVHHPEEFLNRRLDPDQVARILDQAARLYVDSVIFQGDGEPLLHPDFMAMARAARERGINVLFFTNGALLDEAKARQAVELGVEEIYCSLPAGDEATFRAVNPKLGATPGAYSKIVENCARLIRLRAEARARAPRLTLTHVIHTLNADNLVDMARAAVHIGADRIRFYLIRLDDSNRFLQLKPEQTARMAEQLREVRALLDKHPETELVDNIDFQLGCYAPENGSWARDTFLQGGCMIGWFFCLVPAALDTSFCCHLRTTGHLDGEDFASLWFSPRYEAWRVQAKHMRDNPDVRFLNGAALYDVHCTQCDNHQNLLDIRNFLDRTGLIRYAGLPAAPPRAEQKNSPLPQRIDKGKEARTG